MKCPELKKELLERRLADRALLPPLSLRLSNPLAARDYHVNHGRSVVSNEEYDRRLSACEVCARLVRRLCVECGALVPNKAWLASWQCPIGHHAADGECEQFNEVSHAD